MILQTLVSRKILFLILTYLIYYDTIFTRVSERVSTMNDLWGGILALCGVLIIGYEAFFQPVYSSPKKGVAIFLFGLVVTLIGLYLLGAI